MFRASLCPSSGDRLYRTASGVSLDVLAAVVCSQDTQCTQLVSWLHTTAASTSSLTPNAVLSVFLLTMGIMMLETCWVNLKWINIFTCVIRWFFLLLYCIIWLCVFSLRHPACNAHASYYHLWCAHLYDIYIFSTLSHKRHDFWKKKII